MLAAVESAAPVDAIDAGSATAVAVPEPRGDPRNVHPSLSSVES